MVYFFLCFFCFLFFHQFLLLLLFFRTTECSNPRTRKWGGPIPRGNMGNSPHILSAVHCIRCHCGPEEGTGWWAGLYPNRVPGRSQHPGRWVLHWGFHEPSKVIWAGLGQLGLGRPLGLLGWASRRWWARWAHVSEFLHGFAPACSYSQRRRSLLTCLVNWSSKWGKK